MVITGEGQFDRQSLSGKATGKLIEMAAQKPLFLICGQQDEDVLMGNMVHRVSLSHGPESLKKALQEPQKTLRNAVLENIPVIRYYLAQHVLS